jgi:cytochrome c5
MRLFENRNASARRLLMLTLLSAISAGCVLGQSRASGRATIPFEFVVAGKTLPAGTYTFSLPAGFASLSVQPADGQAILATVITRLGGPSEFRDLSFVFDTGDGGHVLSEVWLPGSEGVLVHSTPKGHSHEMVVGTAPAGSNLTGKAAFDRTCRRCHGPEGKGEPTADSFFKTKIPRLGEAYVQSKSDVELAEIISKGKNAMDPVRIEDSGFRHLLPSDSVQAVVTYLRTLKK